MLDLIYPSQPAPLEKGTRMSRSLEMLPIIDETGVVLSQAPRSWCHSGHLCLHPVVHLEILDRQGRFVLQHRSASKTFFPHYWDVAVGGHVAYGEYIMEALYREADEEIGLKDFTPVYMGSYIYESEAEKEIVASFAIVGDYKLKADGQEVSSVRRWTVEEIESKFGKGVLTPTFEQEYSLFKERILALL